MALRRPLRGLLVVLLSISSLLLIAACGQSGPLVLPSQSAATPAADAQSNAVEDEEEEEDER